MLTRSRDSFFWKSDISKKMYSILGKGVDGVATNGCVTHTQTHTHTHTHTHIYIYIHIQRERERERERERKCEDIKSDRD